MRKGEIACNKQFPLFSQSFILYMVLIFHFKYTLTHYQTTNFRLFSSKLKEFADDNFKFGEKWKQSIQTGRKHCGKRRNCSLQAISSFPTVFTKGLFPRGVKKVSLCGNGLKCRLYFVSVWTSLKFCCW